MVMSLQRKRYLRRNINQVRRGLKSEPGQVNLAVGLFLTLFLVVYLFACLQTERFRAASLYMEDALATSNLASALVDLEQYGIAHKILIAEPVRAYQIYQNALKNNLNLDDTWNGRQDGVIRGRVTIENYTVYNVDGTRVLVYRFGPDGATVWEEVLGAAFAPNGLLIENTSVYSEISFPVEICRGVQVTARKGKLADIAAGN